MITLYCASNLPPFLKRHWVRDLRGLWAAEECGVPYQVHWLDAGKGEAREATYKAINPFGTIPAMTDDSFVLFESAAIVSYLCDKAGRNIPVPRSKERALYDQWCFAALNTVEPPVFQLMIASALNKDATWAKERAPQLREAAIGRLSALDRVLTDRAFLLGDTFSGADILMGQVLNFIVDGSLLDAVPCVKAYYAGLKLRPAYVRALAVQPSGKNAAVGAQ
ncbi:MAG: glutathione S-transferase family protein [Alphaproteobacteria bacterium]|nr:glutathione S-transferase family protein [Alphaproteobacteria bacterium]